MPPGRLVSCSVGSHKCSSPADPWRPLPHLLEDTREIQALGVWPLPPTVLSLLISQANPQDLVFNAIHLLSFSKNLTPSHTGSGDCEKPALIYCLCWDFFSLLQVLLWSWTLPVHTLLPPPKM